MDGRAGSSRDGAPNESGPSDDRYLQSSASPDARMSRRNSPSRSRSRSPLHSRSLSRSSSDASVSHRSSSPQSNRYSRQPRSASPPPDASGNNRPNKTALRIDHLTHNVREAHLHHIFGWYGQVKDVHLRPGRGKGKERDGYAYIFMSSVEEAAKAALYMSGGQIDGASLTIKTCEPPTDLPPQRWDVYSRGDSAYRGDRRADYHDRRNGRDEPYRARSDWQSSRGRIAAARGLHPDRLRMVGSVSTGRHDHPANGVDNNFDVHAPPKPMRRWGHDPIRDRNRSASPPLSPQRGARRRSSEAMRASPSY